MGLLRGGFKLIYLLPKQKPLSHPDHGCGLTWLPCPLIASQDWTETFDDDQSNHHKTSDRARQNMFKMYIMTHRIWVMHTSNLFLQTNDLLICWRTWDV